MDLTVETFKIGGVPIDVADKQSRENISAIQKAISSLKGNITDLQGSITNIQSDIDALNDITDSVLDDISSTQGNVSSLQTSVSSLQTNVSSLQTSVSSLQTSVSSLQTGVSSLQTSISSLQTSVNTLSKNVSTIQTSVNSLETNVANLETNVANLETRKANNADFNTQYISVTGSVIDAVVCNRKGNISLELGNKSLKSTLNANTWTTLLTLPSGYRPISRIYRTLFFSGTYPVIIEISTDGVLRGYSTTTLNTGVACYDGTEFI